MKLFLTILTFFIYLNNNSQTNDSIYILFKNDKLHIKKLNISDVKKATPSFTYEYKRLSNDKMNQNLLFFNTTYEFYREIPPIYKPKSFIKKMKKKGKIYNYKQFIKMGYEKTKSLLYLYNSNNNKIFIQTK